MVKANEVIEPHPEPYADLRLDDNLRRDISDALRMIEEYEKGLASLSFVTKEGNSENGYAEAEYAKVEQIAGRLRCQVASWESRLMIVDAELTKTIREYQQIERDGRNIAIEGNRAHYDKALFDQNRRRRKVEQEKDQIADLLTRIRRALREGDRVKWPFGTPKSPPPVTVQSPQGAPTLSYGLDPVTSSPPCPGSLGSGLEGLLNTANHGK